jgi:hypothetical protein
MQAVPSSYQIVSEVEPCFLSILAPCLAHCRVAALTGKLDLMRPNNHATIYQSSHDIKILALMKPIERK